MTGFFLAAALTAIIIGGCGPGEEPEVIGEKREPAVSGEQTLSPEGGGQPGPGAEEGVTVGEQVQAPERYKAELKEEGMSLRADAPVTVPDVKSAAPGKSQSANFTEEEYGRVKQALAGALQLQWGEETSEHIYPVSEDGEKRSEEIMGSSTTAVGTASSGAEYNLSYQTSREGNAPPLSLIWMTNIKKDGRGTAKPARIFEMGETPKGQEPGRGRELEEKAKELIQAAGFGDYGLLQGRWKESYYRLGEREWPEMGYWLIFTPVVEGISCAKSEVNLLGNSYISGPYIEVVYLEDGALGQLKIIGKEEFLGRQENENFLLPFEAVHQLFEQYCKDFFGFSGSSALKAGEELTGLVEGSSRPEGVTKPEIQVEVKNVKLEYAYIPKGEGTEMDLIPVWNFYGSIRQALLLSVKEGGDEMYWTARQEPEGLILSIRADDGRILTD